MSRKIYFIISFGFASLYLFKYTYLHNMGTKSYLMFHVKHIWI